MAEERLNRIETKLDDEIGKSAEFRGELRQFMENTDRYVKLVSGKSDKVEEKVIALEAKHDLRLKPLEDAKVYAAGALAGVGLLGFGWVAKIHLLVKALSDKIPGHS